MVRNNQVNEYMARLDHPRKRDIEALRTVILGADPRIREGVKWNAPSFYIEDHFATFKLRPRDTVQVVLHRGAKTGGSGRAPRIADPTGLMRWAADDRCVMTFEDSRSVRANKQAFAAILKEWIAQL